MRFLLINLLLAILWVFLWGELTLLTLVVGVVFGYLALMLFARMYGRETLWEAYGRNIVAVLAFAWHFFTLIVRSNWQIAKEILLPGMGIRPRIIRYDVTGLSDVEAVAFANAVTLTPGTLVVDDRTLPDGRRVFYVHSLYAHDPAATVRDLDDLRSRMEHSVFPRRTGSAGVTP